MQKINTTRFGEIEINEDRAVHFPDGLLGFSDHKDYIILEHKEGSPFIWLQSTTSPDLAFVLINPFLIKSDYLKGLSAQEETLFMQNKEKNKDILVFALVTIPRGEAEKATVNLLGPVVIDPDSKIARQVILADSGYSHCHPLKEV